MKPKSTLRNLLALAGSSLLALSSSHAATLYFDGGTTDIAGTGNGASAFTSAGGTWDATIKNWDQGDGLPYVAWNNGDDAVIAGSGGGNKTLTIGAPVTVGALTLSSSGGTTFVSGASEITINNGIAFGSHAGIAWSAPIKLGGDQTWSLGGTNSSGKNFTGATDLNGHTLTWDSALTNNGTPRHENISGSGNLINAGTGNIILSGTNTYDGGTTINSGTLRFTSIASMPSSGNVQVNNGGILGIDLGTASTVWTNGASGVGTLGGLLSGLGGAGTSTVSYSGNVGIDLNVVANTSYIDDIADVGDSLALYKTGGSALTLSGNNTYSGGTTISAGTLNIGSVTALGSGPLAINGGTIDNTTGSPLTLDASTVAGAFTFGGTNDLTLSTAVGSISSNTNTVTLNGTNSTLSIDGVFTNNNNNNSVWNVNGAGNTLVIGGLALSFNANARTVAIGGTGNLTITGAVTKGVLAANGGGLTKNGTGTLTLSEANTYTGATLINAGTLAITGATQATSSITFTGGSLGLDTASPVTAASAAVDLTNGTIKVTGSTGAASYTLLTAASITGTPVLAAPVSGYELQLANGDTELRLVNTGGASPYDTWSGGAAFGDDANGDGVSNGLAFLLGAANPNVSALDKLPTVTETAGGLVLTFDMLDSASRGTATLSVEHSSDLGIGDAWEAALVPDVDNTVNDVVFDIEGSGPLDVTATIPVGKAAGGKLFGRLKAVNP